MFTSKNLVYAGDNVQLKEITMAGVPSGHPQRYMEWKQGDQMPLAPCDCGHPLPGQVSKVAANWACKIMPSLFKIIEVKLTPKEYATSVITNLMFEVIPDGVDVHSLMSTIPKSPVKIKPKVKVQLNPVQPVELTPAPQPETPVEVEPISKAPDDIASAESKQAVQPPPLKVSKPRPVAMAGSADQNTAVANALKANKKRIVIG